MNPENLLRLVADSRTWAGPKTAAGKIDQNAATTCDDLRASAEGLMDGLLKGAAST